jgi:hypothetical protein
MFRGLVPTSAHPLRYHYPELQSCVDAVAIQCMLVMRRNVQHVKLVWTSPGLCCALHVVSQECCCAGEWEG